MDTLPVTEPVRVIVRAVSHLEEEPVILLLNVPRLPITDAVRLPE